MTEQPCPFCEINTGRAPATFVHEWSDTIAITPLNPVVDGHILVIPKKHTPDFAADPDVAAEEQPTETQAPEPETEEQRVRAHVTTLHLIGEQLAGIESWMWEHLADVRDAEERPVVGEQPDTQEARHCTCADGGDCFVPLGHYTDCPANTQEADLAERLERGRSQLIEAMSGVSEERTCCGWASDWARTLHAEGGIWETLGRAVGWPTGNYDQWVWVSWDEAAAIYAEPAP